MRTAKVSILVLALLALTSCQTAEQRKPLGRPPVAAAPVALPPTSLPPALNQLKSPSRKSEEMAGISALIDQAEAAYTAGLNDYQSGNLGKAKQEFDRALSVLMESKYRILRHERLKEEFDLLADNINEVERASLKAGNSLSSNEYVPAPIQSFAGLTFAQNNGVMARAQQEINSVHSDIPLISNESVSGVIAYIQEHSRGYMDSILRRLGRYKPMMSAVLRKEGVPQDLIYVAAGESAFNPHAVSRAGATGIWQFMSGTAALYGLKQNHWIDEREDPYKSTMAAAKHLKSLYSMFGDWYLAMAAYDWSPDGVETAIQRTGYADYWTLRKLHALPPETENYVPIYIATALIAKDPLAYGFNVDPDPPLDVDRVPVSVPTDLRLVADLVGCSPETLRRLNPALREWATPADDPGFELSLPAGTGELFRERIASVPPGERLWWRALRVRSGDTLAGVARRYRVPVASVAAANHLSDQESLAGRSFLLIPRSRYVRPSRLATASGRWIRRRYYYRIRRGDNLDLIADRFAVTTYQIRRWNHLRSSRLIAGRKLLIYRLVRVRRPVARRAVHASRAVTATARASGRRYYYRIRRGDTLDRVADRFNVTAVQIRSWNHMRSSSLIAGRTLLIYRDIPVSSVVASTADSSSH